MRVVQAMKPGQTVWDAKLPGFGARRQTKCVSYFVKYRLAGVQKFATLGRYPGPITLDEARKKAKAILGQAANGIDSVAPKGDSVGAVIDEYLAYAAKSLRPESLRHTQAYLRGHWSMLHRLPIVAVKRRDVARGLAEIEQAHSSIVAARARTALSALFSYAIRQGHELQSNPVVGTSRPATNGDRTRVLSEIEIAAVWRACDDSDFGRIIRLLILTGQRRNEIGMLRWSEVETTEKGSFIRLPPSRTKNNREHIVPLSPLAATMLPPRLEGRDWVFGNGSGFSGYSNPKAVLDERSGVRSWVIHDCRRSFATLMGEKLGVLPHIIEAVLNHQSGTKAGIVGVYQRSRYLEECRAALSAWAEYIERLTS
jgi:integrase